MDFGWSARELKKVYVDKIPDGVSLLRSNTSALPEYSEMKPSKQLYYAIEKKAFYNLQKNKALVNANETEGEERQRLILNMRGDAIRVMTALRRFNPTLIGSVWRGTARRGSDIDITVFDLKPDEVVEKLTVSGYTIDKVEKIVASKVGMPIKSHHILVILKDGIQVEVVVRLPEEKEMPRLANECSLVQL